MATGDGSKLLEGRPTPCDELINELRQFLRDTKEENRLPCHDEEHSEARLIQALRFALDDYNYTPPQTNVTFDTYPSLALLIHGASIFALEGAGIFHARNEFNYADGGINVRIHDKTPLYQSWINNFYQMYEKNKAAIKVEANLEDGYGGSLSPYSCANRSLRGW